VCAYVGKNRNGSEMAKKGKDGSGEREGWICMEVEARSIKR
jgi:hypothetical protein